MHSSNFLYRLVLAAYLMPPTPQFPLHCEAACAGSYSRLSCCAPSCGGHVAPARALLAGSPRSTNRIPCAQGLSDQGWQQSLVPEQNARRRRGRSRRRRARPHSPRNNPDFSAASLHGFVAANLAQRNHQNRWMAAYPGAPNSLTIPMSSQHAAHIVLPWIHRVFSNLKTWALGVYHACEGNISKAISTNSSSDLTAVALVTPPFARYSPSPYNQTHYLRNVSRSEFRNRGKTPGKLPRHGIHSRLELSELVCLWPGHPAPLRDLASMN